MKVTGCLFWERVKNNFESLHRNRPRPIKISIINEKRPSS